MKKLLVTILSLVCVFACVCVLAACGNSHTHNYTMKYDETYHWQECSVSGCTAKTIERTVHSFDAKNICTGCGYVKGDNVPDNQNKLSVEGYSYVFSYAEVSCDSEELSAVLKEQFEKALNGTTMAFFKGGVCTSTQNGITLNGTYTQTGEKLSVTIDGQSSDMTVTENSIRITTKHNSTVPPDPDSNDENDKTDEGNENAPSENDPEAPDKIETDDFDNFVEKANIYTRSENETIVTLVYVKGTGGNNPVDPPDPDDGTVWCKHKTGDLWHVTDSEDSTCQKAGWILDIYVCKGIDKDPYKGEMFCGKIFSSVQAAVDNNPVGKVSEYELGFNDFTYYRQSLPLAEHTPVIDEAVAGTCLTKGKTEGSHCGVCNTVIKAQTETDFADHSYTYTIKSQGATTSGDMYKICSTCGKFENKDISYKMTLNEGGESYTLEKAGGTELAGQMNLPYECNGKPVTVIGREAFDGCDKITYISIPSGITTIVRNAFNYCTSLERIFIPNSVKEIGLGAFYGCSSLKDINIPDSVTKFERCFYGCTSIESLKIPYIAGKLGSYFGEYDYSGNENVPQSLKTVTISCYDISYEAFKDCTSITKVTLGESVTCINYSAFSSCTGLTEIRFSDGLKYIEDRAFSGCSKLEKLTNVPDSLEQIGDSAFKDCVGLKSIWLGSSFSKLNSVWYNAFDGCSIETATIPAAATYAVGQGCKDSLKTVEITSGDSILHDAFENCTQLIKIIIFHGATKIEYDAFKNCSSLTSITIPYSVTSIGSCAFQGCSKLTSIIIPDSVTKIEYDAFKNCSSLTSITIPDEVTSIEQRMFFGCSNLTSITIPCSVTSIQNEAFYDCSNLTSITFQGTMAQWNDINKGYNWSYDTGNYTIHCTDGDIAKES